MEGPITCEEFVEAATSSAMTDGPAAPSSRVVEYTALLKTADPTMTILPGTWEGKLRFWQGRWTLVALREASQEHSNEGPGTASEPGLPSLDAPWKDAVNAHRQAAVAAAKEGRHSDAIRSLTRALMNAPREKVHDVATLLDLRSRSSFELSLHEAVVRDLDKYRRIHPCYFRASFEMGCKPPGLTPAYIRALFRCAQSGERLGLTNQPHDMYMICVGILSQMKGDAESGGAQRGRKRTKKNAEMEGVEPGASSSEQFAGMMNEALEGSQRMMALGGRNAFVYTLHVSLQDTDPVVWRRIRVGGWVPLLAFSRDVLLAMGWTGGHMHKLTADNGQVYGCPEQEHVQIDVDGVDRTPDIKMSVAEVHQQYQYDEGVLDDQEFRVRDAFVRLGQTFTLEYDFGDSWRHTIRVEEVAVHHAQDKEVEEMVCIDGANACPPEDVGGTDGYHDFVDFVTGKTNEHRSFNGVDDAFEWAEDQTGPTNIALSESEWDPTAFDIAIVNKVLREHGEVSRELE